MVATLTFLHRSTAGTGSNTILHNQHRTVTIEMAWIQRMKEVEPVLDLLGYLLRRHPKIHAVNHPPICFSKSLAPNGMHRFTSSPGVSVASLVVELLGTSL